MTGSDMASAPPGNASENRSDGGFVQRLEEYKELVAILAFFLGGFFWIQNQFPTKTDLKTQIGVLSCLLDKYMSLTQLQNRAQTLEGEAQQLREEIAAFGADQGRTQPPLSPAMKQELDSKNADLRAVQDDLRKNAALIQAAGEELARNVCGKPQ
jgi:hypothetical protein